MATLNNTPSTGYKKAHANIQTRRYISLCLSVFQFLNEIFFGMIDSELLQFDIIRFKPDRILKLALK